MRKTWLIAPIAATAVLMLWLGGEEPPAPDRTVQQKAPTPISKPQGAARDQIPQWQGGPVYEQTQIRQAPVLQRFRPLNEKEQKRVARSGPAPVPTYRPAPAQSQAAAGFHMQVPGAPARQYRFRPLEPTRERYTGNFPQPVHPAPVVPAWPTNQGTAEQFPVYRRQSYPYPTPPPMWANNVSRR